MKEIDHAQIFEEILHRLPQVKILKVFRFIFLLWKKNRRMGFFFLANSRRARIGYHYQHAWTTFRSHEYGYLPVSFFVSVMLKSMI